MARGENGGHEKNGSTPTTTAIGPSIVIRGKLKSDEDLIVKGRIEAEITSSKALLIENSGIVKANVRVKSARISGVLVGNITAEERVEIAADGRMVGDIIAPKIIINDGAAFRGRIEMVDEDSRSESRPKKRDNAEPVVTAE
jgi:cytoskeletal protein CcmA (bactofilin family)